MAFNFNEFLSQGLPGQGARPNLFNISFVNPIDPSGDQKMTLTAKAAQLPPMTIGTIIAPYFGRQMKIPGDRTYPEWTVTIMLDDAFETRNAIERWSNSHGPATTALRPGISQWADVYVRQFKITGEVTKEYKLVGAWPSDVSPIEVSWESNDILEEFTVTFNYQYWESDTTT